MRAIKFRGQCIGTKEWIEGAYVPAMDDDSCDSIIDQHGQWHLVYSATVSQFTELTDKNGKEIYDGDVVEYKGFDNFDKHDAVEWSAITGSWWCGISPLVDVIHNQNVVLPREFKIDGKFEVIGSIHSNPELLKNE